MPDSTALVAREQIDAAVTVNPDGNLTPQQKALVADIAKTFDPQKDPMSITQFGIVQASKIAELADPVLKMVRGKDQPQAAMILDNIGKDARKLNFADVKKAEQGLKMPNGMKKLQEAIKQLKKQVESLDTKMKKAEAELEADKNKLTARANTLYGLLQQSLDMYSALRCYVYAADAKLAQLNTIKGQKASAAATAPDPQLAQQEITALQGIITRLTARRMALAQMQTIAVQQVFSIQTVLNNNVGLLDMVEINKSAVSTVWKTQVVIALSAYEQTQVAAHLDSFADNLGAMMTQTADQIGTAITATAAVQAKGIAPIEAIEEAGAKMVENINLFFQKQAEVEQTAKETSVRLETVRGNIVNAVASATGDTKGIK